MLEYADRIGKTVFGIDFSMSTDDYIVACVIAACVGYIGMFLYGIHKRNK